MKNVPNFFTLLNLVFGCIAIIFILQQNILLLPLDSDGNLIVTPQQLGNTPEKIWLASLFIGLAAIVDFLDGFVARLFKAGSAMGKQLDSLADLVSFGVAPAMIIYQFLRLSFAQEQGGLDISQLWLLPSLLLACAAAWRLARFNLDNSQSYSFKGLPVPATGIFVASLPLIYWNVNEQWVINLLLNKWFLYGLVLLLSWLMVSSLPLMALKFKDFGLKNNLPKYLLAIIAIASVLIFTWMSVPVIILAYVLLSLLFKTKSA
ncbi:MAG TPA: CDP-alcohol phosphatidyltransferase family protein [Chitinophagaceae bacterium]